VGSHYESVQPRKPQIWVGWTFSEGQGDAYHVLQVSDLDTFADEEAFISALSVPTRSGDRVEAVALSGERLLVDLTDMGLTIDGAPRPPPPSMLHDCGPVTSEYGSGRITIRTAEGTVTLDADPFRPEPPGQNPDSP